MVHKSGTLNDRKGLISNLWSMARGEVHVHSKR